MASPNPEAKAWANLHDTGLATSSGSEYIGENVTFFSELMKDAAPGRMLDIGTGNMPVPRINLQLKLSDLEIHAIDVADIRPANRCPGVEFRVQSSESTDYPDAWFDLVTGSYALEYSDIEKSLTELVRVMKPGATAGFIMHHPDSLVVQQAVNSFRVWQESLNVELKLLQQLNVFRKIENFIAKPSAKNRKVVEGLLQRLDRPELVQQHPRVRALVDAMHSQLQAHQRGASLSVEGYRSWSQALKSKGSAVDNTLRHKAMQQAVVRNPDSLRDILAKLEVDVHRFDVIESDVILGSGPTPAIRHGLIGWALVFRKKS